MTPFLFGAFLAFTYPPGFDLLQIIMTNPLHLSTIIKKSVQWQLQPKYDEYKIYLRAVFLVFYKKIIPKY